DIEQPKDTNNNLASLSIDQGTLTPVFGAAVTSYNVDYGDITAAKNINISATLASSKAAFSAGKGPRSVSLNPGESKTEIIEVRAENGATKAYAINFKSKNGNLSKANDLTAVGGASFTKSGNTFSATVPYSTRSITTTYTKSAGSTAAPAAGVWNLNVGANTKSVIITPEYGSPLATYTLNVTREQNTDNDLTSLNVSGQTLVPGFSPSTTNYVVNVPFTTSSVTVQAGAAEGGRTAVTGPTNALQVGDNTITVNSTSQSGAVKAYTIIVKRAQGSSDNLLTFIKNEGVTLPGFSPSQFAYTINLPYNKDSVSITAGAPANGRQEVTGSQTGIPAGGTARITATGISQSGVRQDYVITVNRAAGSKDATLGTLGLTGVAMDPAYNPAVLNYTAKVDNKVTSVDIFATANADGGAVRAGGTGTKQLVEGPNTFTVVGEAQDTNAPSKSYTIVVTRAGKNADSSLASLSIPGVKFTPDFVAGTNKYAANIPYETDNITVNATANPNGATIVSGTGNHAIAVGKQDIAVVVKAENGDISTYTISVTRAKKEDPKSADCDLKSLSVFGEKITPSFSKDVTSYRVKVDTKKDSANINASANHSKATVRGDGKVDLKYGETTRIITVKAENGAEKKYSITFERPDERSKDNALKSLSVKGQKIVPTFREGTLVYNLELDEKVSKITILADAKDDKSKVSGTGTYQVPFGNKNFNIKVTAENGDVRTYTIKVKRASKNNNLSDIVISAGMLDPKFDKAVNTYNVNVPFETENLDINAIPEVSNSKIEIEGARGLKVGQNRVVLRVISQGGEKKEYILNVFRAEKTDVELPSENHIKDIQFPDGVFDEKFDPNVTTYTVNVGKDVDKLDLKVFTKDPKAKVTIVGNDNLKEGANRITITVTAQNGQNKTYVITAIKGKTSEGKIVFWVITAIVILLLLLFFLLFLLKKKKDDGDDDDYDDDDDNDDQDNSRRTRVVREEHTDEKAISREQLKQELKKEIETDIEDELLEAEVKKEIIEEIKHDELKDRLKREMLEEEQARKSRRRPGNTE
ncbi:MAG: cadherin-like beta sandwich domain-containing protein, partial [Clostridia bacterium]